VEVGAPAAPWIMPRAKKSSDKPLTAETASDAGLEDTPTASPTAPTASPAEGASVAEPATTDGGAGAALHGAEAAPEGAGGAPEGAGAAGDGALVAADTAAAEATTPPGQDQEKKWYVVHTYSGYEGKVRANLEKRVESMLMQDKIFRVIVPTEDEIEYKDGRKVISKKKIFPGYVLVEMIMSDDSWYVVRNTPGVTGFVGSGAKPVPLDASEVKSILRHMGVDEPRPKVMYEDGESVKVISGPFMGFVGKVREVNLDKGKLRVFVSMFGRETPVELDFSQVEKL